MENDLEKFELKFLKQKIVNQHKEITIKLDRIPKT